MDWRRADDIGDAVAVGICCRRQITGNARVFVKDQCGVARRWRIVHRANGHRHRISVATPLSIADAVAEAIGSGISCRRGVDAGTFVRNGYGTVRRRRGQCVGYGIAIGIACTRQHAHIHAALIGDDGAVARGRRIVHRGHGNGDRACRSGIAGPAAIVHRVSKLIGATEPVCRGVGVATIRRQDQDTAATTNERPGNEGRAIAINVSRSLNLAAGDGNILRSDVRVGYGLWGIVAGRDVYVDRVLI